MSRRRYAHKMPYIEVVIQTRNGGANYPNGAYFNVGSCIRVDWGDGTVEQLPSKTLESWHNYPSAGDYTVRLYGDITTFSPYVNGANYSIVKNINFRNGNKESLISFDVYSSPDLSDVSFLEDCRNITSIYISNCGRNGSLGDLNIDGFSKLSYFNTTSSSFDNVSISNCPSLSNSLSAYNGIYNSLNVSNCDNLTQVQAYNSRITEMNIQNCPSLTTLNCYNNQLTSLDVSTLTSLTTLNCFSNQLTSLDVSANIYLQTLSCYNNPFVTNLVIGEKPDLYVMKASGLGDISSSSFDLSATHNYNSISIIGADHIKINNVVNTRLKWTELPTNGSFDKFIIDSNSFEIVIDSNLSFTDKTSYYTWLANHVTTNNLYEYPQMNRIGSKYTANETRDLFDVAKVFLYDSEVAQIDGSFEPPIGITGLHSMWQYTIASRGGYNSFPYFKVRITCEKTAKFYLHMHLSHARADTYGDRFYFNQENIELKKDAICDNYIDNGDGTVTFDVSLTKPIASIYTNYYAYVYEDKYPLESDPYISKVKSIIHI